MKKIIFKNREVKRDFKSILKSYSFVKFNFQQMAHAILNEYKLGNILEVFDIYIRQDNLVLKIQDDITLNWSLDEDYIIVFKNRENIQDIKYYDVFKKCHGVYSKLYQLYSKEDKNLIELASFKDEKEFLNNSIMRTYSINIIKYGNPTESFTYKFIVDDIDVTIRLVFAADNKFNGEEFVNWLYSISFNNNVDDLYSKIKDFLKNQNYFIKLSFKVFEREDFIVVDNSQLIEYKRYLKEEQKILNYKNGKTFVTDCDPSLDMEELSFVKKLIKKEI